MVTTRGDTARAGAAKADATTPARSKLEQTKVVEARLRLAAVDRSDPTLLHDQVAAEIRRAIADGEARPGGRIPQAKDLAAVLGVNTNTVLRALRLLREEGLLEMGRGRAIVVAGTPERGVLMEKMRELVALGRHHGYRQDELAAMLQALRS